MSILVFDLKGYRIDAKLSQKAMAEKLGITQSMVSHYERNKTNAKLSTISWIAKKLDVPPGALIREIPEDEIALFDYIRNKYVMYERKPKPKKDWIEETIREVEEAERKAQEGDLI